MVIIYSTEAIGETALAVHVDALLEVFERQLELIHGHAVVALEHLGRTLARLNMGKTLEEVGGRPLRLGEHLQILRELAPLHERQRLARLQWLTRQVRLRDLRKLSRGHGELSPLRAEGVGQGAAQRHQIKEALVRAIETRHQLDEHRGGACE